ncbi:MAG: response regulator transcription factor [Chloroflexi bacterium]|nr:response regulator transcription factor [Chloroflexota bacterium]
MTDTLAPHLRPETAAPIRVLIIDAHPAIGLGLTRLVSIMPGVEVCGLAARGEDGLTCADLAPPDVALVDAELPNEASLATIRRLRHALPTTRVVALGLYSARRAAALAAGAHAFLLKDAGFDALRAEIVVGSVESREDQASVRTPRSA